MTTGQDKPKRWSSWTIEIKVWKILAALIILPILVKRRCRPTPSGCVSVRCRGAWTGLRR
jgi:hypothetical protein